MKSFRVQYIVTYFGEDYSDYEYPEFEIDAEDITDARDKARNLFYDEVRAIANNYDEGEYYASDFEIIEVQEIKYY